MYIAKLMDDPVPTARSYKAVARIFFAGDSDSWIRSNERVRRYFEPDSSAKALQYGAMVLLNCSLKTVSGPSNPGEFNYRRYLKYQGIYRTAYLKKENWHNTGLNDASPILKWSRALRRKMLNALKKSGIDGKEFALAAAVLLGYDASLDDVQRRQYAGAGAMHVLCVSGLHVGILAMVMSRVLFFLNRKRWGKMLKFVLLIGFIWLYATVTGFSPSVLRAATMFSFIYAGKSFRRNVSIYNMLAASAFVLLMIEPRLLVQVGFQLSYLAVIGIVLLFKPIHGLLSFLNGIGDKIWQLTAVSIAATTTTFPLSLFYFHQFPNLFLLTNLVAIPAAFLIVYLGMGVLFFSFFPGLSGLIGKALNLILYGLNRSVGFVEGLPFATTKDVSLTAPELFILFGCVFVAVGTVVLRKRKYLSIAVLLFTVLLLFTGVRKARNQVQKKLIVYNIPGHSSVEFIWGTHSVFFGDSSLLADSTKIGYAVNGFRIRNGVRRTETFPWDTVTVQRPFFRRDGGLVFFGGCVVLLPGNPVEIEAAKTVPGIDLAILTGQYQGELIRSSDPRNIRKWVLDSSVPPWKIEAWKDSLDVMECSCYDVRTSGAFVLALE
jgi:competence protein ComEC